MKHYLQSDSGTFYASERFDPYELIAKVIEQLTAHPDDLVTHCKDHTNPKFAGLEIVDIYEVNPKTGKPSKAIDKGGRVVYVPLVESEIPF
jgi:hypothetical protein